VGLSGSHKRPRRERANNSVTQTVWK
jgi:hypothetical protein